MKNAKNGFTLMEILIVVTIIVVIATVILVAINPLKRFQSARNSTRWRDSEAIADAVLLYQVNNGGAMPAGLDAKWHMIGKSINNDCGGLCSSTAGNSFVNDNQASFDLGNYNNTRWDTTNAWVMLNSGSSGSYLSQNKDGGGNTNWLTISWLPVVPYGKELPNNGATEVGYPEGANMNGNLLLLHLNDGQVLDPATFIDSSGQGNNGSATGTNIPTWTTNGVFKGAYTFDGNDRIGTPLTAQSNDFSIEIWFKDNGDNRQYERLADKDYVNGFWVGRNTNIANSWGGGIKESAPPHGVFVALADGVWHQIVSVRQGNVHYIYGDGGTVVNSNQVSITPLSNAPVAIGAWSNGSTPLQSFTGTIDEVSYYNRALTPAEIMEHYKRGALRLKFQVRSCAAPCNTETFIGPDGTNASYYTEIDNSTLNPPLFTLQNLSNNRYFQYQASFETDKPQYSPDLKSTEIVYSGGGSGAIVLELNCVDLASQLTKELPKFPKDPNKQGAGEQKTYYSIKRTITGQVDVVACGSEGGESILVHK